MAAKKPPSVFDFTTAPGFFKAWYKDCFSRGECSYRSIARDIGVTVTAAHKLVNGDSPVPEGRFSRIAKILGLKSAREQSYFRLMVQTRNVKPDKMRLAILEAYRKGKLRI
jgi:hypothetical protein